MELGFTAEHIPDLVRLACDRNLNAAAGDSLEVFAPTHAWRALAQLRAGDAVPPLLGLLRRLKDDDFIGEELPIVCRLIGPAALDPVIASIAERPLPMEAAIVLTDIIGCLGADYPEIRPRCIDVALDWLAHGRDDVEVVNGFLICTLIKLEAASAIDAIKATFTKNLVDISICGDLEDVEIALGLRESRLTPPPAYFTLPNMSSSLLRGRSEVLPASIPKVGRNDPCPCGSGKKFKKCCLCRKRPLTTTASGSLCACVGWRIC